MSVDNKYIVECWKCGEQAEKSRVSVEKCMRCHCSLIGDEAKIAQEKMKKPAYEFPENEDEEPTAPIVAVAEWAPLGPKTRLQKLIHDDIPKLVVTKIAARVEPKIESVVDFLKNATATTSGIAKKAIDKIVDDKNTNDKIQEDVKIAIHKIADEIQPVEEFVPIKESILAKQKQSKRAPPIPKTNNIVASEECTGPKQYVKSMRIVELRPGQHFYCEESGLLIVGRK